MLPHDAGGRRLLQIHQQAAQLHGIAVPQEVLTGQAAAGWAATGAGASGAVYSGSGPAGPAYGSLAGVPPAWAAPAGEQHHLTQQLQAQAAAHHHMANYLLAASRAQQAGGGGGLVGPGTPGAAAAAASLQGVNPQQAEALALLLSQASVVGAAGPVYGQPQPLLAGGASPGPQAGAARRAQPMVCLAANGTLVGGAGGPVAGARAATAGVPAASQRQQQQQQPQQQQQRRHGQLPPQHPALPSHQQQQQQQVHQFRQHEQAAKAGTQQQQLGAWPHSWQPGSPASPVGGAGGAGSARAVDIARRPPVPASAGQSSSAATAGHGAHARGHRHGHGRGSSPALSASPSGRSCGSAGGAAGGSSDQGAATDDVGGCCDTGSDAGSSTSDNYYISPNRPMAATASCWGSLTCSILAGVMAALGQQGCLADMAPAMRAVGRHWRSVVDAHVGRLSPAVMKSRLVVARFPALRELRLTHCANIRNRDLLVLARSGLRLSALTLGDDRKRPWVSNRGLGFLCRLTSLSRLTLQVRRHAVLPSQRAACHIHAAARGRFQGQVLLCGGDGGLRGRTAGLCGLLGGGARPHAHSALPACFIASLLGTALLCPCSRLQA